MPSIGSGVVEIRIPYWKVCAYYLVGQFFNNFLPANIGGGGRPGDPLPDRLRSRHTWGQRDGARRQRPVVEQLQAEPALRAAVLPVVSYLGPAIAGIITGSVVIEQIFGIPGIGRYFVQGALNRDYTLVMGVVIFYGALIIVMNLLVDLAYGLLDPKVRYD
jgi:hypothetical protein